METLWLVARVSRIWEALMTRRKLHRLNQSSVQSTPEEGQRQNPLTASRQADDDRLDHFAELIANGEAQFEDAGDDRERQALVTQVGRKRRIRLVNFIARAIAHDILRCREPPSENST